MHMAAVIRSGRIFGVVNERRQVVACISSCAARKRFIDFFQGKNGHKFVPSSPVILRDDPSVLFVNAGMNQFKPKFLETIDPHDELASVRRAVNSQKCIRVGGKHNDLEDVGKSTSHHTFFEMLGSWSFGDYFKEQACQMALELLTKHFKIPEERLYFTYFQGDQHLRLPADSTTQKIWRSLGVADDRILPFGVQDNFWEMGDIGPCGPCTEIHYDHIGGSKNRAHLVNKGHPDVVEIWNVVFMQYNRLPNKDLVPLPTNHVDTGMGLERITAVLQGKKSNYDTDLFRPIIDTIQKVCKCPAYSGGDNMVDQAYRILSDHVRMITMAISDRVYPGNTGAELIVRQILRRAYLTAKNHLSGPDGLLNLLSMVVIASLSSHYTYLRERERDILATLDEEEKRFCDMLHKGKNIFHKTLAKMETSDFPVKTAILLHNHYGYPLSVLLDGIRENNLALDLDEFNRYQEERERLKKDGKEAAGTRDCTVIQIAASVIKELNSRKTQFTNPDAKYQCSRSADRTYSFPCIESKILAIVKESGNLAHSASPGERCALVMSDTCFYHTEGGQVCDTGTFSRDQIEVFRVSDVTYGGGYVFHHGTIVEKDLELMVGDKVQLKINAARREACMRAHTATHLLNHALREILSPDVSQYGSRVSEDDLRFTFVGPAPTHSDLERISKAICAQIEADLEVAGDELSLHRALEDSNIRRLPNGIYSDPVRIVSVGYSEANNHSVELCGGTHVKRTSDIEHFALTMCKSQGTRKTTMRCLTASLARASMKRLEDLQERVQQKTNESTKLLSNASVTMDDCLEMKSKVGKLNYQVNCADISAVCKIELKEKLRKHSQMLGTKMRVLRKRGTGSFTSPDKTTL